jgi:hypothetical protein
LLAGKNESVLLPFVKKEVRAVFVSAYGLGFMTLYFQLNPRAQDGRPSGS